MSALGQRGAIQVYNSRRSELEDASHQRKSKTMKHIKTESSLSSEVFGEQRNYHTTSDSSVEIKARNRLILLTTISN